MNPDHVLEVDTKGICLLCLNAAHSESAPVLTRASGDPGDEIHRIVSYRTLMRYLKINVLHLEHFATLLLQLEGLDEIPVLITMCYRCITVVNKFSSLYKEFELIRMQMQTCLSTLYDDMTHGDKVPSRVLEYNRRMTTRQPFELMKASFAESLRMDTINKCFQKIDANVPRVSVKRSRSPVPVIKATTSLAPPPINNDSGGCQNENNLPTHTVLTQRAVRVRKKDFYKPCPRSERASNRVRDSRGKFLPIRIKRERKSKTSSHTPHCSTDTNVQIITPKGEVADGNLSEIFNEDFTELLGKLESADCEVIMEDSEEFIQHENFDEVNGPWETSTVEQNEDVDIYEDYGEGVGGEIPSADVDGPPVLVKQVEDHTYAHLASSNPVKKSVKKKPKPLYTRKFKCLKCSKKFGARGILQRHMRTVHAPDKSYKLEVNNAISHLFIDTECTQTIPYGCPYCRRKFNNIGMLKIHFSQNHMDKVAVKMSELNESNSNLANGLSQIEFEFNGQVVARADEDVYLEPVTSIKTEHPPEIKKPKPKKIVSRMVYKCKVCFAICKTQGQLKYHMLKDHSEPFKCDNDMCTYKTLIKKRLIAHKTSPKCPILAPVAVPCDTDTDSWKPLEQSNGNSGTRP